MRKNYYLITRSIITLLLFSSCTNLNYWYCYVDAIGEQPLTKTYFAENRFPEGINPLIAKEYLNDLDITMSHLGYTKVDSANAAIKIAFGYDLGKVEERAYTYSTPVYQYKIPSTTTSTTNSSIKNAYGETVGKIKSSSTSTTNGGLTYGGERLNTAYETKQQLHLFLDAFDTKTKEPIWSVRVKDETNPSYLQNMRKWMPFYMLNMFPYIGKNSGEMTVSKVYYDDPRLQWYNSQTK